MAEQIQWDKVKKTASETFFMLHKELPAICETCGKVITMSLRMEAEREWVKDQSTGMKWAEITWLIPTIIRDYRCALGKTKWRFPEEKQEVSRRIQDDTIPF